MRSVIKPSLLLLSLFLFPGFAGAQNFATDVAALLAEGSDLSWRADVQGAYRAFSAAIARDPENIFALNQLGLATARLNRVDEARERFERVVELAPDNVFARTWLGILALGRGDAAQGVARFSQVLKIDPANAGAHYYLGVVRLVERDRPGAVEHFARASRAGSLDPQVHYRLARAYDGLDMAANARIEYERALDLDPRHANALDGLGWRLFNDGATDAAIEVWRRACELRPGDPLAKASLGVAYSTLARDAEASGNGHMAAALWKNALEYDPTDRAAKNSLSVK